MAPECKNWERQFYFMMIRGYAHLSGYMTANSKTTGHSAQVRDGPGVGTGFLGKRPTNTQQRYAMIVRRARA